MELKRLPSSHIAWLLDGQYEIRLDYNHGYSLTIKDLGTLVDTAVPQGREWVLTKEPQEHVYVFPNGASSNEKGWEGTTEAKLTDDQKNRLTYVASS